VSAGTVAAGSLAPSSSTAGLDFQRLPFDPDEGFPQAFRLALGERTYLFSAYVNVTDDGLLASTQPLVLPQAAAFLVVEVSREDAAGPVVLLHRKVVPGLVYGAGELAVTVLTMAVHPLNLNGAGTFGSQLVAGVAR
jgi:hypothetical protein